MKIKYIILCWCFYMIEQKQLFAQKQPELQNQVQIKKDTLHWSKVRKLTWNDFKGIPDTDRYTLAATASGLYYETYFISYDSFGYIVYAIFYRDKSWVRENQYTQYGLNHEQKHFDITAIHAAKLRRAFKLYKYNRVTFNKDCEKIYTSIKNEKDLMHKVYDSETSNSINKQKQAEWNIYINQLLSEYDY